MTPNKNNNTKDSECGGQAGTWWIASPPMPATSMLSVMGPAQRDGRNWSAHKWEAGRESLAAANPPSALTPGL